MRGECEVKGKCEVRGERYLTVHVGRSPGEQSVGRLKKPPDGHLLSRHDPRR